jgi:hypothetical protein
MVVEGFSDAVKRARIEPNLRRASNCAESQRGLRLQLLIEQV